MKWKLKGDFARKCLVKPTIFQMLLDYKEKGHAAEFVGKETKEGTEF
jgi:hypothetical protein